MRSLAALMKFGLVICLFLALAVTTCATDVYAAIKHGCAPLVPPPVSGTLIQPPAQVGLLYINEVLLAPNSTWNCTELNTYSTTTDTWVEIYNTQNQPFDLYSVHASLDSGTNTNPFYFPFGSAIAPHGYLVVFPRTSSLFLTTESASLRLLIAGIPVDSITLPALPNDYSYARIPDGTATWQINSNPTIGASNALLPAPSPTPTHTPTRTLTHTPTSTTHSSKGSGSGSYGGTYGSGSTNTGGTSGPVVDGTQPAWSTLHLPTADTTPYATDSSASTTPTQPTQLMQPTNMGMDILHKVVITILLVLLAATLFWCWRLFREP